MNNPARNAGRFLSSRIGGLLGDEAMSDIKFLVGEELEEFPAHKLIFGASSDEFFNGFYAMTPADNIIKLPEIKVESFKEFLSYIYSDEADINPENVLDIMKLGDRYGIQHLMTFCYERAVRFIDDQLHLFDDLLNFCKFAENDFLDMIAKDPLKYLTADNVEKLNKECLKVILEAKETKASETQLFDLAVLWARQKTSADNPKQIRANLGDLILFIRFPTMTAIEFETCVEEHPGILDAKDVIKIVLYISKQCGNCKYPVEKRNMEKLVQSSSALPAPRTRTYQDYGLTWTNNTCKNTDEKRTFTEEFFFSESSFTKPAQTYNDKPLNFSVKAPCFLKSISFYVNGQFDETFAMDLTVSVSGPRVNGVILKMAVNHNVSNRFQRRPVESFSIDLREKVLLDPQETYSIMLRSDTDSNSKFKRIVLSFPKEERDGNIVLSPMHKSHNCWSPVSSICYRLQ